MDGRLHRAGKQMVGKPLEADGLGATEEEGAFEGLLMDEGH